MIFNELKQHGTADFPFELYRVTKEHPKYDMAFHWHTNLELVRVLDGILLLTLDNKMSTLNNGDIAFINSEIVHGATPQDCRYECIVFNLAFLKTGNMECDGFIDNLLSHTEFLHEYPQDNDVKVLVHRIFDTIAKNTAGVAFQVIGLMQELLGTIQQKGLFLSHLSASSLRDEKKVVKLKIILKYMREHFSEEISLEDMASIAGFSCKYFCKFFKEATGTTPVNYLMSYRVERAARMLLGSDLSVTQISLACGFNDLSYFIKTFKRFRGVSPTEYRKR